VRTRRKLHPALKHGGHSAMALLPGESRADFEKLHRDLISEFAPAGALEDEIVADMAGFVWRKQNLASFQIAKGATRYYEHVRREKLPVPTSKPMPGFATVETILGMKYPDPEKVKAAEEAAVEQARKDLGWMYEFVEIGEIATIDRLMKEIDVHERLDAMIDRCLKRLLCVRGVKSLSPASQAAQPPRIPPLTEAA
jgi:hypothetical protein